MYWWNGGTLRKILRSDHEAADNLFIHYTFRRNEDDNVVQGMRLCLFRSKRKELAWALINIMNAVHKCGWLHNDLLLDNIRLHFPPGTSNANWGLTSKMDEPKRSPWIFTNAEQMQETIAR